jgi:hypothetical protein
MIFIGGEDEVTRAIAKRLAIYCFGSDVKFNDRIDRDRGTKALRNIPKFVSLGEMRPVICVFDSDNDCIRDLLKKHAPSGFKSPYSSINIVYGEGEDWLVADRQGFAAFFQVDVDLLPLPGKNNEMADAFRYKTSKYLLKEFFPKSRKKVYRERLVALGELQKPPEYNELIVPFVDKWDIDAAKLNSMSLLRAIERVRSIGGVIEL